MRLRLAQIGIEANILLISLGLDEGKTDARIYSLVTHALYILPVTFHAEAI